MLSVLLLWEVLSKGITRRKMADEEGVRDLSEDVGNLSVKDGPCVGVAVDESGEDQNMTAVAMVPVTAGKRSCITTEEEGISDIAAAAGRAVEGGSSEVGDTETPADVSPPVIGCPVGHVSCGSDTTHVNVEVTDASLGGCGGDIPAGCVECGDVALAHVSELQETCVSDGQEDGEVGHDTVRERDGRQDWHEAVTDGKPVTGGDVSFGHVTTATTACQAESDCAAKGGCNTARSEADGGASADWQPQSSEDFCDSEEEDGSRNYRKVFVGNIGYKQNWRELKDFFSQFGKVVYAQIVSDYIKRRSRGIGFVEFATREEAQLCLREAKMGLIFKGRKLRVDYATESWRHREDAVTKLPPVARTTPDYEPAEGEEDKSGMLTVDEWAVIFSYLTISEQILLERVCKGWRDMALLVWKRRTSLSLKRFSSSRVILNFCKSDRILTSILSRCGPFLSALDLGQSNGCLTDYCLTIIEHYCPHLRKLNLAEVRIKTTGLKNLSKVATDLKWINLQRCLLREKGLWWLLKNCQKLEHVNISWNNNITGKCFHMVGPHLKSLHATKCIQLTDYCVEKVAQKCPNIQELRLDQCSRLTKASLVAVTKLTSLEVLDFSRYMTRPGKFDDASVTLLSNLHNLRELRLDYMDNVTDNALKAVTQGCPKLQMLSLRECNARVTRRGLTFLLGLKELSTLDVSYIKEVDNIFLERLSAPGRLQGLTLHCCHNINDNGVQRVLELSPRLRHLDVSGDLVSVDALIPLTNPVCMVDRLPHHTLEIVVGSTLVTESSQIEDLKAMQSQLPPHVILNLFDRADVDNELTNFAVFLDPRGGYGSDDEEDEYAEFYRLQAQANNQHLQPAGDHAEAEGADSSNEEEEDRGADGVSPSVPPVIPPQEGSTGQMEDNVGEAGEEGACGPSVPEDSDCLVEEDLGAEVNNDWPVEEDWGAEVNNDWPVEEDWGAEVNPPGPTVPVQVMADDLRAYDDFFDDDEDYDEFLVNDDPLEMERWDLS